MQCLFLLLIFLQPRIYDLIFLRAFISALALLRDSPYFLLLQLHPLYLLGLRLKSISRLPFSFRQRLKFKLFHFRFGLSFVVWFKCLINLLLGLLILLLSLALFGFKADLNKYLFWILEKAGSFLQGLLILTFILKFY